MIATTANFTQRGRSSLSLRRLIEETRWPLVVKWLSSPAIALQDLKPPFPVRRTGHDSCDRRRRLLDAKISIYIAYITPPFPVRGTGHLLSPLMLWLLYITCICRRRPLCRRRRVCEPRDGFFCICWKLLGWWDCR